MKPSRWLPVFGKLRGWIRPERRLRSGAGENERNAPTPEFLQPGLDPYRAVLSSLRLMIVA